jgi:hypothetical protein
MSEVVRGGDLSVFGPSRDHRRKSSLTGTGVHTAKSLSPHNRAGLRSSSPHVGVLKNGKRIDMNLAYRRLSDANLALSSGGLSSLGGKARERTNSDTSSTNNSRLQKDYLPVDGDDVPLDSSDDDRSSDEEGTRGRKGQSKSPSTEGENKNTTPGTGRARGPRSTARSLIAAAEEERKFHMTPKTILILT